jgi:hypothetical protein
MTREKFIEVLDEERCGYILDDDGRIIINQDGSLSVFLPAGSSIPPGVVFNNRGFKKLGGVISIQPGVEFNSSEIIIKPLFGYGNGYLRHQQFHIDKIDNSRLFNLMISKGIFI